MIKVHLFEKFKFEIILNIFVFPKFAKCISLAINQNFSYSLQFTKSKI